MGMCVLTPMSNIFVISLASCLHCYCRLAGLLSLKLLIRHLKWIKNDILGKREREIVLYNTSIVLNFNVITFFSLCFVLCKN